MSAKEAWEETVDQEGTRAGPLARAGGGDYTAAAGPLTPPPPTGCAAEAFAVHGLFFFQVVLLRLRFLLPADLRAWRDGDGVVSRLGRPPAMRGEQSDRGGCCVGQPGCNDVGCACMRLRRSRCRTVRPSGAGTACQPSWPQPAGPLDSFAWGFVFPCNLPRGP